MSYYKIINGIRYDRSLLEAAEAYTQGRGEWQISLDEIQTIYSLATDADRLTETEWRSLRYIAQTYPLTRPAREWLDERFAGPGELTELDALLTRILRQEFGLSGLQWEIPAEEADRQNRNENNVVDFADAIRRSIRAFLERGFNQLSLQAVAGRAIAANQVAEDPADAIRAFVNTGALFLPPARPEDRENFPYDLPDFLNTDGLWYIGLHIPAFAPVLFLARGARNNPFDFHGLGYLSRRPALDDLISVVVRQLTGFQTLRWQIDPEEVTTQLAQQDGQNFGEALFAALHVGIFNGESSLSFRDFIRQEIWEDPERGLDSYLREYIETGTLYLLNPETGAQDFGIPDRLTPDYDFNWVFGLEMPARTDARFLITAWRERNLDASWNDGFPAAEWSFEEQARRVLEDEFDLPGLELIADAEEYDAQRRELGPDYRTFSSLLRQALNTILHDYLHPNSVFNTVARKHAEELRPEDFASTLAYRAAVSARVRDYLPGGSLELLPRELPDNNPVDGEAIEEFWQFFGHLPALHRVGFWVIIPRYPDDGQLPYAYGFEV